MHSQNLWDRQEQLSKIFRNQLAEIERNRLLLDKHTTSTRLHIKSNFSNQQNTLQHRKETLLERLDDIYQQKISRLYYQQEKVLELLTELDYPLDISLKSKGPRSGSYDTGYCPTENSTQNAALDSCMDRITKHLQHYARSPCSWESPFLCFYADSSELMRAISCYGKLSTKYMGHFADPRVPASCLPLALEEEEEDEMDVLQLPQTMKCSCRLMHQANASTTTSVAADPMKLATPVVNVTNESRFCSKQDDHASVTIPCYSPLSDTTKQWLNMMRKGGTNGSFDATSATSISNALGKDNPNSCVPHQLPPWWMDCHKEIINESMLPFADKDLMNKLRGASTTTRNQSFDWLVSTRDQETNTEPTITPSHDRVSATNHISSSSDHFHSGRQCSSSSGDVEYEEKNREREMYSLNGRWLTLDEAAPADLRGCTPTSVEQCSNKKTKNTEDMTEISKYFNEIARRPLEYWLSPCYAKGDPSTKRQDERNEKH